MLVTISGSKKEMSAAIASLDFSAGKLELSTPEVVADKAEAHSINNGNGHRQFSAAARKRMSIAQQARWAKTNGKNGKK